MVSFTSRGSHGDKTNINYFYYIYFTKICTKFRKKDIENWLGKGLKLQAFPEQQLGPRRRQVQEGDQGGEERLHEG